MNSGCMVKEIRIKLGLKQEDISCEGISRSFISYLERGLRTLDMELATKISNQMNKVITERIIKIDFKITPELLIGRKENEIQRLISNLKDSTKHCYTEIDEFLETCTRELGITLIKNTYEEVFKYNFSNYRNEIIKYYNILLKFQDKKKERAEIYVIIIKAKLFSDDLDKYKEIIEIDDIVNSDIELCDDLTRISYYHNVAVSYYHMKHYDEALKIIKKAIRMKENPYRQRALTIEANICIKQQRYERAINIYLEIIKTVKDINDIANAYSNLADIYNTIGNYGLAILNINKALEFVESINDYYKYNLYYVKLQIEINQKSNIYNTLKLSLSMAKELKATDKSEIVLKMAMEFDKSKENYSKLIEIIRVVDIEVSSCILLDMITLLTNDITCKKITEISHY